MSVALAFLRRDFLIWSSYRLAVVWQVLGLFVILGLIYFAGTTVGDRSDLIGEQSGSYVAFVLVGFAFTDVLAQGMNTLPQAIRDQQKSGTFEPMMLAPVSTITLALSSSFFRFVVSLVRMAFFIGFGVLVLGYWHHADPLSVMIVMLPALASFAALGVLSSAFIILVKQGDPILLAYGAVTVLLGGMLFPVSALPAWLRPLADLVPLTHALSGVRAGLNGSAPIDVLPQVGILLAMTAVFLPLGIWAFNWAIDRAKREGSLAEY